RLLRCLRAAVATRQARAATDGGDAGVDKAALRERVDQAVAWEGELLLDPDYFATLDGFTADIRLKRGTHHNELTRYRYDVVLTPTPADGSAERPTPPPAAADTLPWTDVGTLTGHLAARVAEGRTTPLRVVGVPNARLAPDLADLHALDDS